MTDGMPPRIEVRWTYEDSQYNKHIGKLNDTFKKIAELGKCDSFEELLRRMESGYYGYGFHCQPEPAPIVIGLPQTDKPQIIYMDEDEHTTSMIVEEGSVWETVDFLIDEGSTPLTIVVVDEVIAFRPMREGEIIHNYWIGQDNLIPREYSLGGTVDDDDGHELLDI